MDAPNVWSAGNWRFFMMERAFADAGYFSAAEQRLPGRQPTLYRSSMDKLRS
jgi:hypothetical protein